ncbi:MAG: cytochrome c3 family protein [Candidatus Aminicenantia bacterium]
MEDCGLCHERHRTVVNNLLKQNEPFLCFQCREIHQTWRKRGTDLFIQNSCNPADIPKP